MSDLVRESTFGQFVNWITNGRLLPYRDQKPDYQVPERYLLAHEDLSSSIEPSSRPEECGGQPVEKSSSRDIEDGALDTHERPPLLYVVDWDGDDDPDNPKNWSPVKKAFVLFNICLLTFSVYAGSTVYTSSIPGIVKDLGVTEVVATLGLSLYVLSYGFGPLILSPLQEVPLLGRNPVYMITLFIFAVLQVPLALANNIATILVLRAITGFFASPALATGAASIGDVFVPPTLPYAIGFWAISGVLGPILGPIVGDFAAQAESWRWPIWELFWMSGASFIFLFFFMPETYTPTILLRRARRLRKLTGNHKLKSLGEIQQESLVSGMKKAESRVVLQLVGKYLWRPIRLMMEPDIFFINIYMGLAYAIFYLWFEAFPLVFGDIYHMSQGVASLPFLGIVAGSVASYIFYCVYLYYIFNPAFKKAAAIGQPFQPEKGLKLAAVSGALIPISLFTFGWTSRPDIHWIVPIISAGLYMPGIFLLFQSKLVYVDMTYGEYAASALAGNAFFRSWLASAFPLFGRAFYKALGIGGGCSLLAGAAIVLLPFLWLLIHYGPQIHQRSSFANQETSESRAPR